MTVRALTWTGLDSFNVPLSVRVAGAVIAIGIVAIAGWQRFDVRGEDALIYARYGENIAEGRGPVYNDGDERLALSGYLYAFVLAAPALLDVNVAAASNAISLVAVGVTAALLAFAVVPGRGLRWALAGAAAAGAYSTASLAYESLGVEMPLALLLWTSSLVAFRYERLTLAGLAAGLAATLRPELFMFAAVLFVAAWWRDGRAPIRAGFAALAVVVPFAAAAAFYYGSPVPDALSARMDQAESGFFGGEPVFWHSARDVLDDVSIGLPLLAVILGVAVAAIAAYRAALRFEWADELYDIHRAPADTAALVAAVAAISAGLVLALYLGLDIPAREEHLLPLAWAAAILIPVGAVLGYDLGRALYDRAGPICLAMAAGLVVALVGANLVTLGSLDDEPDPAGEALAVVVAAEVPASKSCVVGTAEPGRVGSYLPCVIADPLGLVTAGNSAALAAGDLDAWIAKSQPDYLVSSLPLEPYEDGIREAVLSGAYAVANDVFLFEHRLYRATGADLATLGSLLGHLSEPTPSLNEDIYPVGGEARAALFMHVRGRYAVPINAAPGNALMAYLGVADGAERSAGVTFRVTLEVEGQEPVLLLEQAVVPGAWVPVTAPLPEGFSGPATIALETDTVAGGTTEYGWAVWGEPRVAIP